MQFAFGTLLFRYNALNFNISCTQDPIVEHYNISVDIRNIWLITAKMPGSKTNKLAI